MRHDCAAGPAASQPTWWPIELTERPIELTAGCSTAETLTSTDRTETLEKSPRGELYLMPQIFLSPALLHLKGQLLDALHTRSNF